MTPSTKKTIIKWISWVACIGVVGLFAAEDFITGRDILSDTQITQGIVESVHGFYSLGDLGLLGVLGG